ncbi:restriction endonuclease subunit S [Castellaniella sp. GW247-6E4]|uniref:restriction endonuclease subunit S n=1 Tax=Castellaniella sp. GW247-6E4 TaxID=3140380 RepID=UPI0033147859
MTNNSLDQMTLHAIGGGWGDGLPGPTKQRVSVIRGTDIPRLRLGDFSTVPVRFESEKKVKNRLLQNGDIVIEISGGSAASGQHTGRALLITEEMLENLGGKVIPASFCRLLRLDQRKVDPAFVVYQIDELHLSGEIAEFENQSTGISNFQFNRFLQDIEPRIKNPSIQRLISISLQNLDKKIVLNLRINQTLETMAQAIFKSWFVDYDPVKAKIAAIEQGEDSLRVTMRAISGKTDVELDQMPREHYDQLAAIVALFPNAMEDSKLGEIPTGWEVKPISDLVETVGGSTPNTKNESYWNPAEYFWTSPKDLSNATSPVLLKTERKISALGLSTISSGLLPVGTLLMSSRAPIGYLAITQVPLAINQGYIAMPPGGKLSPLYLLMWCQQNMDVIKGQANGSTFMEISKKAFRPILALFPKKALVDGFISFADPIFRTIVSNSQEIIYLSKVRDTLLPELLAGDLSVDELLEEDAQ